MRHLLVVLVAVAGCSSGSSTLVVDDEHALFDTVTNAPASERTFTFTNEGGGATPSLQTQLVGDVDAFHFGTDGCAGTRVQPGKSCQVTVRLANDRAGSFDGELLVSGAPLPAASVLLAGKITPAQLSIVARGATRAEVIQGGAASTQPIVFDVHNGGGAATGPLVASDIAPFVTDGDCVRASSLAGGASCSFYAALTAAPLDAAVGETTHTLTLGDGTTSVSIDVTARVNPVGALTVDSVDFSVPAGMTVSKEIVVHNATQIFTGDLQISVVDDASNPQKGLFTLDSSDCANGLATAKYECRVVVSAQPTVRGSYGATIKAVAEHVHAGSARVTMQVQ